MGRVWWLVVAVVVLAACGEAAARGYWSGGVYFGVPPVVISPYGYSRPYYGAEPYYAPPYYAQPYHAQPYHARPAASEGCYAGAYVCPLEGPSVVGMPCSCPTVQGPAWGRAR